MIDSIKQLLQQEAQAVLNIPVTDAYEKAVQLIVEQIHHRSSCTPVKRSTATSASYKKTICSCLSPTPAKHAKSWN